MLRSGLPRVFVRTVGVLVVGAVAFSVASTTPRSAQADKQLRFTVDDLKKAIKEESLKTPFYGEFGGVTFKDVVTATDLGCAEATPVDEVPASTMSSPLVFKADFLPMDLTVTSDDAVAVCGDHVISYAVRAVGPKNGRNQKEIYIGRFAGKVAVSNGVRDRMSEVTVAGKPAVLIQGLPLPGAPRGDDPQSWKLVIVEDFGVTMMETRWVPRGELLRLAEGLR